MLKLDATVLSTLVSLVFLLKLLNDISDLVQQGEVENAHEIFSLLDQELDKLFRDESYKNYSKIEMEEFYLNFQNVLTDLIKKQNEIKIEVAAFNQLGSNKVIKKYLSK